jgi:hypothetical protein
MRTWPLCQILVVTCATVRDYVLSLVNIPLGNWVMLHPEEYIFTSLEEPQLIGNKLQALSLGVQL